MTDFSRVGGGNLGNVWIFYIKFPRIRNCSSFTKNRCCLMKLGQITCFMVVYRFKSTNTKKSHISPIFPDYHDFPDFGQYPDIESDFLHASGTFGTLKLIYSVYRGHSASFKWSTSL